MRIKGLLLTVLLLALSGLACTRTISVGGGAQATATEIVVATETPTTAVSETATLEPSASVTATATLTPTETNTPTASATLGVGTPSTTPTALAFDPNTEFGSPTVFDTMDNAKSWADNSGNLPDSSLIKLALSSGQMQVTGKLANFDTWWFTYLSSADLFLQMQVETGSCSGKQSYGFILHGPSSGDFARGYLLHFSCDGSYRLERLDNTDPYKTEDIIGWKASEYINDGSNQTNLIGVRFEGDTITIYANGRQIDQVDDDNYPSGRFGLFVNGGAAGNFTYSVNELSFWDQ